MSISILLSFKWSALKLLYLHKWSNGLTIWQFNNLHPGPTPTTPPEGHEYRSEHVEGHEELHGIRARDGQVAVADGRDDLNLGDLYTESGQTLQGSFSAVSTPIFASKYALESSRRDLHNALLCTVLNAQNFRQKSLKILLFFSPNFANFDKFSGSMTLLLLLLLLLL